jgi:hypothetical protein
MVDSLKVIYSRARRLGTSSAVFFYQNSKTYPWWRWTDADRALEDLTVTGDERPMDRPWNTFLSGDVVNPHNNYLADILRSNLSLFLILIMKQEQSRLAQKEKKADEMSSNVSRTIWWNWYTIELVNVIHVPYRTHRVIFRTKKMSAISYHAIGILKRDRITLSLFAIVL